MLRPLATAAAFALAATLAAAPLDPESASVLARLAQQTDAEIAPVLARESVAVRNPRETARTIKLLSAAFAQPASHYHHDPAVLALLLRLLPALRDTQEPDGSFDSALATGNVQSPPDSAFTLRHLCLAQQILLADAQPATAPARDQLRDLIARGAEILRTGGVHTPNHRWVICGALARIEALYPSEKNIARIDAWLAEGIDQDADGQFSERSPNYAHATLEPLLDVATVLHRPALLEPIRRNLAVTLRLAEPNGDLDAVASRRQDQLQRNDGGRTVRHLAGFYAQLRHLAIVDHDGALAAAVRLVERDPVARLSEDLAEWMTSPTLREPLPPSVPLPENSTVHLANSALVRLRRGATTASIYGGSDWHAIRDISSGLATNPTFFKFRKGAAILDSVRLTPGFFSLGFFRSAGLVPGADGRSWQLRQTMRAAYYQPLPADLRNARGDYPLTNDGRYYSKLDFPHRPHDDKTLTTRVTVRESAAAPGAFELAFDIDDTPGIAVTLELCFRPGGKLEGATPRDGDPDSFFLKTGLARYTVGGDTIEFGPGVYVHPRVTMQGEDYAWRAGTLRAEGLRIYLTGVTPFHHTLTVR